MKKSIPFLTLDSSFKVCNCHNRIDKLYPFLTEENFFTRLFSDNKVSDFSSPVICCTYPTSEFSIKLLVTEENNIINCYVIEDNERIRRHNAVSYRMREPISSIFALLPVIVGNVNNDRPEKAIYLLEELYFNTYRLMRNVSNLSIADKIDTGMYSNSEVFDFSELLQNICNSSQAIVKNMEIDCEIEKGVIIQANQHLISNGILNLISNSIIYRNDENIRIAIRLYSKDKNAVFSYRDNSKGIQEEHLQQVFRPFYAVDPYGDGSMNISLGLGLYIAESAFKQAGGNILLRSAFGSGVKYTAAVPLSNSNNILLESKRPSFLLDKYSDVFIQLCDECKLPDMR